MALRMNFREKWQLRIVVLRAPHGGTSGSLSLPAWWYFGTPHPPARHGDSADLRRKRTIGISKPHGGTSGPLNMLLWWYFETPTLLFRWYFEVPNAKIICPFAGILAHEPRVLVVLNNCCFSCF